MAVDVHAGKAIDQRAAGKLHLLQIDDPQLPGCEGLGQQAPGQADQFGIVARQFSRPVVVEIAGRSR